MLGNEGGAVTIPDAYLAHALNGAEGQPSFARVVPKGLLVVLLRNLHLLVILDFSILHADGKQLHIVGAYTNGQCLKVQTLAWCPKVSLWWFSGISHRLLKLSILHCKICEPRKIEGINTAFTSVWLCPRMPYLLPVEILSRC